MSFLVYKLDPNKRNWCDKNRKLALNFEKSDSETDSDDWFQTKVVFFGAVTS